MRLVGIRQCGVLDLAALASMIVTGACLQTNLHVAQVLAEGQLGKSQGEELIPAGKPAQPAVAA